MGRSLATEWGPKGIRVNSLCPGYMKTDLIINLLEKEGTHIEEGWVKDVPMGRLARKCIEILLPLHFYGE